MENGSTVVTDKFNRSRQQRCICNKLVCIVKGNNIEIKCNKCKRIIVIKTKGVEETIFK